MKGIYRFTIKGKTYVGQDSYIGSRNRYSNHVSSLRKGDHFNPEMQSDFDEHGEGEVSYEELVSSPEFSKDNLNYLERYFIHELGTFNSDKGYNRTKGGVGMLGYRFSDESKKVKSEKVQGEDNPQSKISNDQFYEIVELLKEGKTNSEIAEEYDLHSGYVSLLRHKRRFSSLWETVPNFTAEKSSGGRANRRLDYEMFKEIVKQIEGGCSNAFVEREYALSSGTGSRLRHKKIYKDFWNAYEEEHANGTSNDYRKQA